MRSSSLTCLFILAVTLSAAIPRQIAYQGILTDKSANPLPDSQYSAVFSLYDSETGGSAVWSETQTIGTSRGLFAAMLGSVTALNVAFDKPYWISVAVGGTEMSPRIKLAASPYALHAQMADTAEYAQSANSTANAAVAASAVRATVADSTSGGAKRSVRAISAIWADTAAYAESYILAAGSILPGHLKADTSFTFRNIIAASDEGNQVVCSTATGRWDIDVDEGQANKFRIRNMRPGNGGAPFSIDTSGNVYVGGLSQSSIQLYRASQSVIADWSYNGGTVFFGPRSSDHLCLMTANTSRLFINSGGQVGVGTTSPLYKTEISGGWLLVSGTGHTSGDPAMRIGVYDTDNSGGVSGWWLSQNNDGNFAIHQNAVGDRMIINSNGHVGIGIADPGAYLLYVNGDFYCQGEMFTLDTRSSSDRRFKQHIDTISNALDKINGISGVGFEWNSQAYPEKSFPSGRQIGLIAQDVEKVLPELVHTDADGFKSLSYDKLTAVLVEAVKQQQREIEELRERLKAVEKGAVKTD